MAPRTSTLPCAAAPFLGFARHLRGFGFAISPGQVTSFMQAVALLGPRSMNDIREAAYATLAPPPDRRGEFDAHFRAFFHGEVENFIEVDGEEETGIKDDGGDQRQEVDIRRDDESGESASAAERLGLRDFRRNTEDALASFRRELPAVLPVRRSFRNVRTHARGKLDLRRSLREIVQADGDVPIPLFRKRQLVPRKLLILIDISGSMKLWTEDYLRLAHAAVHAAGAEIFTFGTRLTRITSPLRIRDREQALARASALAEDWDGGTRIGPVLLAFLAVPRFSAFARGAAVVILSDGLERGDHAEMETAIRRLSARAWRLSLATPLAGDLRFRPQTAALKAILPVLDDLVDGSSIAALTKFILALARPAPRAEHLWNKRA
ncbi:VWA domain-containing protein [Mesorhizobium sp. LHD-90]|uniref:vWA domain-containing protein n=1 Tax=Mesorhizobium sp. LHD-90 TaxID=3071414 RepID=UPI0027E061EB|nr:VWA domain-containing protein [Mesorhizobium sp. LHD-90]MDQ6435318.1 VWA domain-containing protein [Mesorhizobium sp. LHD-90]